MSIPFSSIPSFNELFLNYINDFNNLKEFYKFDFSNKDDFKSCLNEKKSSYLADGLFTRDQICDILTKQNTEFESSEKTFENIELLRKDNTFVIVTGQQLGFLTGPLYTVFKAISAIKLSEKLRLENPDLNFVPIFWMESDDHDFPEINNVSVITSENEIKKISYFEKGTESEKYLKPSGSIILDEYIDQFINQLEDSFNKTDFSADLFGKIRGAYKSGNSVSTAFGKFMNLIFSGKGLILFDPSSPDVKKLLIPVFKRELDTSPEICENVINTSVDLEKKFPIQVKPKPINLFYIHEGGRYLLEPRENDVYALKHSRQKFSKEELYGLLESNYERFSWNVVTRPICEDYLLPVIAYVGGPSEVSYFGQFKSVYNSYGITMPVVYPRTSATILENRVTNFLEKNKIDFLELLDEKKLSKKLLLSISDVSAEQIFSDLKDELTGIFYTYEKELARIDSNQTESFMKRGRQFIDSLDVAKDKFMNSQLKQSELISSQLRKVLMNVFPEGVLQERVLNITYFLNKYGPSFIDRLMSELVVDEFEHQLVSATSDSKQ